MKKNTNELLNTNSQTKHVQKMQALLAEYSKKINFETELIPYLTKEQIFVFKNFIQNLNPPAGTEIQKQGMLAKHPWHYVDSITRILNFIVSKKLLINYMLEKYGGQEQIDDFAMFLTSEQKKYLYQVLLNPKLNAADEFKKNNQDVLEENILTMKKSILTKFDALLKRKKDIDNFIKQYAKYDEINGNGEDFLIHDFGSTLDMTDESGTAPEFTILTQVMLDYHYDEKVTFARDTFGQGENVEKDTGGIEDWSYFVHNVEKNIRQKLDLFIARKKRIDSLLDRIKIDDLNEMISSLDKLKLEVLFRRTLAYAQYPQNRLAKELKTTSARISKTETDLLDMLEDISVRRSSKR